MNRKQFLQKSTYASLGILSLPFLSTGCSKENIFEGINFESKIIIIGAGAAGLYAGHLLKLNNIDFQLIEASDKIGGRLGKIDDFADFPLDCGAQWLHGKKSILGDLVKDKNIKITEDDSDLTFWFKNQIISTLPSNVNNIFEGKDLPDISYEANAASQGIGTEYKYIIEGIAGDFGADASRLSVYWSNKEFENWSSGDTDYKFQDTLYDVINNHITEGIKEKVVLKSPITHIDYSGNNVILTSKSGSQFEGSHVIITVPITILKENYITFTPPLPANKTASFQKIGMDAGMKVFLKFNDNFYSENILGGKYCAAYVDEKIGKNGNDNVLLAFIMGEQAEYLSDLNNHDALINTLLKELDEMFYGAATKHFINAKVQDWYKMPFIKGAYSYSTIGIGNARNIASESINDKLFFAGEAMNINGHFQTVHGAMESAEKAINDIAKLKP
jgi:monoamine oxidase